MFIVMNKDETCSKITRLILSTIVVLSFWEKGPGVMEAYRNPGRYNIETSLSSSSVAPKQRKTALEQVIWISHYQRQC